MMVRLRRVTAADVGSARAAAALDDVFREYLVPISFDGPAYALHFAANDVDLAASPIWYDGDEVVAAAVLGVRGRRGWIGGFGVAPAHRRRGLGHALLADVLERAWSLGLVSVTLEVLAENTAARRLYEAAGFTPVRRLIAFGVDATGLQGRAGAPYAEAGPLLGAPEQTGPCWQREAASLRRQPSLHAVGDARAFCIFRHDGRRAQLLNVRADSAEQFAGMAASVVAQTGVVRVELFNEPATSATAAAARTLGWKPLHELDEMRLTR
jgi:ribosomal protein S18 acetylase RimI-like enzyme